MNRNQQEKYLAMQGQVGSGVLTGGTAINNVAGPLTVHRIQLQDLLARFFAINSSIHQLEIQFFGEEPMTQDKEPSVPTPTSYLSSINSLTVDLEGVANSLVIRTDKLLSLLL